jgi:hypothetical protein
MRNLLVYVAGPISKGDILHNVTQAHEAGIALLKAGVPCIVPHGSCFWGNTIVWERFSTNPAHKRVALMAEALPTGTTPKDWYGMDRVIVSRCDAVLRLPGESTGADLEVAQARSEGKPVFHTVDEVIAWARETEVDHDRPQGLPADAEACPTGS